MFCKLSTRMMQFEIPEIDAGSVGLADAQTESGERKKSFFLWNEDDESTIVCYGSGIGQKCGIREVARFVLLSQIAV